MTALTTRDALAKALHAEVVRQNPGHADWTNCPIDGPCAEDAAGVIASGAVIDAATLADDEAVYDRVENEVMVTLAGYGHVDGCWVDVAYAALRALAAALTERGTQ